MIVFTLIKAFVTALQFSDVPPLLPLQDHDHGPEPVGRADTVPLAQRLVVGAAAKDWPLAVPQAPLTGARSNAAVTLFAASMVTWQLPVPVHAPDQPANMLSLFGVAVRVTAVLAA